MVGVRGRKKALEVLPLQREFVFINNLIEMMNLISLCFFEGRLAVPRREMLGGGVFVCGGVGERRGSVGGRFKGCFLYIVGNRVIKSKINVF